MSMRLVRFSGVVSVVAACAILAACGDSTSPKVVPVTVDSLLADIGEASELGATGLELAGAGAFGSSAAMPSADQCPYNSTTQRFVCPAMSVNGLTINRFFQLLNAADQPQSAFAPATTAAIRTVTDVSGTVTSTFGGVTTTTELSSHEDHTLSGLLGAKYTLNGNGTTAATTNAGGMTFDVNSVQKITNLVMPKHGSENRYPESGSIAMDVTISGLVGDAEHTVNITLTFNGTSTVTMTLKAGGVTQTCTFDMSSPTSPASCN
jgi:hypothetical protein